MQTIQLVIVDDHSIISAGLQSILFRFPKISVVETFSNGNDFLAYLKTNDPNLVLLDLDLPDLHGIEILRSMKNSKPQMKVAVFTQHDGEYYFHETTQLEVNGYILKSENIFAIPEILLRINNGEYYISREMTQFLKPLRSSTNLDSLEHSIVKLLIGGNTIKEIATSLNKTEKVIEYRLKKIRNIFSAKTNSELGYRLRELYFK